MTTGQTATDTMKPRRSWKRIGFRLLRLAVITYVAGILVFALLQSRLIFMGASTQGRPEAVVTPPPFAELVKLTASDGTPITALFALKRRPDNSIDPHNTRPTVIYFYGNAMCLNDAVDEFQMFRRLGVNVLAVEYAGYGMSGGTASEDGCYKSAEAAYQWLLNRNDIDTRKIVPAGWSLGGAVAIDLARRHAGEGHVCGVITFSTFTSMADVARAHYPGVPVSMILKHHFESLAKIDGVGVPVFIGHGRHDEIAPFAMSDRLATAAQRGGVRVTRLTLDDAGHNDFFATGQDRVEDAVEKFLRGFEP